MNRHRISAAQTVGGIGWTVLTETANARIATAGAADGTKSAR